MRVTVGKPTFRFSRFGRSGGFGGRIRLISTRFTVYFGMRSGFQKSAPSGPGGAQGALGGRVFAGSGRIAADCYRSRGELLRGLYTQRGYAMPAGGALRVSSRVWADFAHRGRENAVKHVTLLLRVAQSAVFSRSDCDPGRGGVPGGPPGGAGGRRGPPGGCRRTRF